MKTRRRFGSCAALLCLALPLRADPPKMPAPGGTAQPVLDGLIGRPQVVGLTERGGSRFLGRVLSGDHGLYLIQTFHYESAPATALQTQTVTTGGRKRHTSRYTTRIVTQNTIPDDVAVQALLRGVAGTSFRPQETAGPREMVSPADILCVQALSPPAKSKADWTMKTLWASPSLTAPKAAPGGVPAK